jgi:Uma2 family endonuclease
MELLIEEEKYTVEDFRKMESLDENHYYELIEGEIVKKNAPTPQHQAVLGNINDIFRTYVKSRKLGTVLFAPIDVFLDENNQLQPDLVFIPSERKHIITTNGIEGVPDLVVEIISPSTGRYDKGQKKKVYRNHKVTEYWIIDPKSQVVEIYVYRDGDYDLDSFAVESGNLISNIFPELNLKAEDIFADI